MRTAAGQLGRVGRRVGLAGAFALVLGAPGALTAACSVYDPALLPVARDAGPPDAGPSDAGEPRDAGPCNSRIPPPRPMIADGPDVPEATFALKDVVLDQGGDLWRSVGYNLDGLCSNAPDPVVECRPPRVSASLEVDGEDGIDNSFGHNFYPLISVTLPTLEADARIAQEAGIGALVLRVRSWNGTGDDPRVDITVTQSVFGTPGDPDGGVPGGGDGGLPPVPDGGLRPPAWMGDDYFWGRDDTFLDGNPERPRVRDDNAYVVGRLAVFRIPDRTEVLFTAREQGVLVRLTGGMATGTLSADGQRIENVIIAGRWAITDMLETAERVGICRGTTQYNIVSNLLDNASDVRSTPGTGGEGVTCDALSLGVSFTGYRAHLAGIASAPALPNPCTLDAGVDGG